MVLENHNDNVNLTKSTLNGKGTCAGSHFFFDKVSRFDLI